MSLRHRALLCTMTVAGAAAVLPAQPPAAGVVRVQVVDTAGVPIPDASVSLVRGVNEVVVAGATDAAGRRTLTARLPAGPVQLVVRKIGHQRADRFVAWTGRDTLAVAVTLHPVAQTLSAVTVTERESVRKRRMTIDADAIAGSRRRVVDALDVVTALRPDMIYGLGNSCGPARNLWVNGARQRMVAIDPALLIEARMGRRAQRATPHLRPTGRRAIPLDLQTMLRSIKPEHVAEITANDCADLAMQRARSESALFVVLKPGVAFRAGIGSFVVDADSALARLALAGTEAAVPDDEIVAPPPGARPPMSVAVTPVLPVAPAAAAAPAAPAVERLPAYRLRVLGVYDEESGAPVAGVDVVDVRSGARTTTTATGTATLAVLPDGGGTVRLVRAGYRTRELPVAISPADTLPITLLLAKAR